MATQERCERLRSPEQRVGTLPNADLPPPTDDDPDEILLLRAFMEADERAFELVLDRLFTPMMKTAQVYVRTRADAEEVVQETWLAALRGIGRFEHRSSLKTWLFRILRYRAMSHGKRSARYVAFSDLEAPDDSRGASTLADTLAADSTGDHGGLEQEQVLLAKELRDQLDRAMEVLPPRQREVMVLRDLDGWSAEEVCDFLGVTDGNQRVLLHRARRKVRDEMMDYVQLDERIDGSNLRLSRSG